MSRWLQAVHDAIYRKDGSGLTGYGIARLLTLIAVCISFGWMLAQI